LKVAKPVNNWLVAFFVLALNVSEGDMTNRRGQSSQSDVAGQPSKLLDQTREPMRARHYRSRTEETYYQWVRCYILFHQKRHPENMSEKKINAFLTHLAVQKRN